MSLINEALKRTRDAAYQNGPATVRVDAANYRIGGDSTRRFFGVWHFVVVGVIIAMLMIAAYGFVRGRTAPLHQAMGVDPVAPAPVIATTKPDPDLVSKTAKEFAVKSPEEVAASEAKAAQAKVAATPPAVSTPAPTPVAAAPLPPPAPPALKLQGVMQLGRSFEAMIDGYNYRVGETVEGCRIVSIDDRMVKLDFRGQEVVLRWR